MNALILAAGYATRVGTLALDRPKALLAVGGRPVLDYLVESLRKTSSIRKISLVTNRKFVGAFRQWAADRSEWNVHIVDDGTTSNEQRLGAIGDLGLAVEQQVVGGDLLVAAADNIFMLSFPRFVNFFAERQTDCITAHREEDAAKLQKTGVVDMDQNGRVLLFEEKPAAPKSHYACPPLYIFKETSLPLVREYLASGNNPDAPGHFIAWLAGRHPFHAFVFEEPRYAVGDAEAYRRAREIFEGNRE